MALNPALIVVVRIAPRVGVGSSVPPTVIANQMSVSSSVMCAHAGLCTRLKTQDGSQCLSHIYIVVLRLHVLIQGSLGCERVRMTWSLVVDSLHLERSNASEDWTEPQVNMVVVASEAVRHEASVSCTWVCMLLTL
jgi:hypothetical protein